ncbi:MAG: SPOR domain-containing protein [Burkholderiaceae bacterium]|nr:SPOR domain-containing protein [Burkholderiaceae bacterium]
MLKFIFWVFLLANGALLAFRLGYFDPLFASKNEPQRMENQLNVDKIRVVSSSTPKAPTASADPSAAAAPSTPALAPAAASTPATVAAPAPAPAPAAEKPQPPVACTEIGEFSLAETKKIEPRLATLSLGERQARRNIRDVASYIVFIPPQGSKLAADKKVAELKRMGVTNYFVIQDNSSLRTGISLGVFKTEAAAKAQLNSLNQKGVRSARIGARSVSTSRVAYQLRDLDAASMQALDKILTDFPAQKKRECSKG